MDKISVVKAKVHNLKSVDVEIPRGKLTVVTGPSGSGKSSLAFDTIYAEGQRRYIESLSSYARQFLGQMEAPDVESITGLSPAIAIDQKSTTKNPRSTVGTVTEVYDYMRVLFARLATAHCPESGEELKAQSAQQIVESILAFDEKTKIQILSPIARNKKGEFKEDFVKFLSQGFSRMRIDGEMTMIEAGHKLDKNKHHNIEVVIDRIAIREGIESRLTDSVELALKMANGNLIILKDDEEIFYSEHFYSQKSGKSYPELSPRLFSFNSPIGACELCNGLGVSHKFDVEKFIFDENLSINDGALAPLNKQSSFLFQMILCMAQAEGVDLDKPFKKLAKSFHKILFEGSGTKKYKYSFESEKSSFKFSKEFPGVEAWLEKKYHETSSEKTKAELESLMTIEKCSACNGMKLNPFALAATIEGKNIIEITQYPLDESYHFFKAISFDGQLKLVADKLLKEIVDRLKFLLNVGLDYLTLNREATTLSGGESQRIRLATQIGSALSGVLYVLDEPSIGLHQRDNDKLIQTLINLRDLGNTVIVVEHDEDTMRASDYMIDMGPGAGIHGGEVVGVGTPSQIAKSKTITGDYLSGKKKIDIPKTRRSLDKKIVVKGASENNLKGLDVEIPLEGVVCLTGVSGSGKSTLVHRILTPAVKSQLRNKKLYNSNFKGIKGVDQIQSIIELDQTPIGRTPKSNPATYTGLFDSIRDIFANTNEAKVRGYKKGRFSFNVKGGRCESCEGNGNIKVEMNFLPDVYITCNDCNGRRYNRETLNILYRGKNIADVLEMDIEQARDFFENHTKIKRALDVLCGVGLGYMKLGQSATTLSGGEAQRLKLSRELSKSPRGQCLYILDEPTTGLHFEDIKILLKAINKLVDLGHSVLVIEHNLDVVKTADWIIDLGPEGGRRGGQLVGVGTPEDIAKLKTFTGTYLKKVLNA